MINTIEAHNIDWANPLIPQIMDIITKFVLKLINKFAVADNDNPMKIILNGDNLSAIKPLRN
jgi:hypothetical protein